MILLTTTPVQTGAAPARQGHEDEEPSAGHRGQRRRCQPGDPSWCLLVDILGKIPLRGPCPPLLPLLPCPTPRCGGRDGGSEKGTSVLGPPGGTQGPLGWRRAVVPGPPWEFGDGWGLLALVPLLLPEQPQPRGRCYSPRKGAGGLRPPAAHGPLALHCDPIVPGDARGLCPSVALLGRRCSGPKGCQPLLPGSNTNLFPPVSFPLLPLPVRLSLRPLSVSFCLSYPSALPGRDRSVAMPPA